MRDNQYYKTVIAPGDKISKLAHQVCVGSYGNCPAVRVVPYKGGNFRGPVGFVWREWLIKEMLQNNLDTPDGWVLMQGVEDDGAGGKPQFFTLVGTSEVFYNLGWEVIVMTADDFARSGRFPVLMANEVNTKAITPENYAIAHAMLGGYGDALAKVRLVNITGETAVMKNSVTAFCDTGAPEQLILTWGATCVGLARRKQLITGEKIRPGMPIVGLAEHGYRCNGGGFFTALMLKRFGKATALMQSSEAREFATKLTVPSVCYSPLITRLVGWEPDGRATLPLAKIAGIAHITGGGVWGKLGDILPKGVGAELDAMPSPPEVLLEAQVMSWRTKMRLTDWQGYGTLHGGCGMLVVCQTDDDAVATIVEAGKFGITAKVVGKTVKSRAGLISIQSRFKQGRELRSDRPE